MILTLKNISAKNNLEAYCFNIKSTIDDEKFKEKIEASEKQTVTSKCDETIRWLDSNQQAEKEEFEHKQKELEDLFNPIVKRIYADGAGGQAGGEAGGMPGGGMPGGPGGPGGMPGGGKYDTYF